MLLLMGYDKGIYFLSETSIFLVFGYSFGPMAGAEGSMKNCCNFDLFPGMNRLTCVGQSKKKKHCRTI